MIFRRARSKHQLAPLPGEPGSSAAATPSIDPGQAWNALSLVNDWIKHAESKVAATLAFTGAAAVMLYNVVKGQAKPSVALSVAAVTCAIALVVAGACALIALLPRVTLKKGSSTSESWLHFREIFLIHREDAGGYAEKLARLTREPETAVRQIAQQVHANSTVAARKFRWANFAIVSLTVALLALATVATLVALHEVRH